MPRMTHKSNRKKSKLGFFLPLVLALGLTLSACSQKGLDLSTISTTPLEKMDLTASVSASGKVESANGQKVFADPKVSTNMIRTINVKVGDKVEKGDILAELDTSSLQRQVEQQEAALEASKKQASASYRSAERSYSTAREQYSDGRGAGVTSAQTSVNNARAGVDSAKSGVTSAQSNVDNARSNVDTSKSNVDSAKLAVNRAELGVENAKAALNTAQNSYNNALLMYELGEYSEDDLTKAKDAVSDAERGVTDAENSLSDARRAVEDAERAVIDAERAVEDAERAVVDAERGVSDAEQSLRDAEKAYYDAQENAADQVASASDSVDSAAASLDFDSTEISIQQIKDQIADCVIYAPMSGTVTLSNATVGNTASGVLFMIEEVDELIIKTTVQQFDAPSVKLGQRVVIKSDGLGDQEFAGSVSDLAPTAVKSSTGDLADGSGIEFETEISVDDSKSGLLIGMSTQLYIIIDEREDVFAVSFSTLATDENGQDVIYVIEGEDEAEYRAVPVEIGLETDYYVEINSPELREGMNVVNNPDDLFQEDADSSDANTEKTTDDADKDSSETETSEAQSDENNEDTLDESDSLTNQEEAPEDSLEITEITEENSESD